ncbi:MAG: hypothetical protein ACRES3_02465, partial [Steroidobacteraceae bacterium]
LVGARGLLDSCLGLEIEVEFAPIYRSQPLFGDISAFLQENDFEFVDFVSLRRWERSAFNGYGQCVFGDALFMRPPETLFRKEGVDISVLRRFIALCALYNRFDWIDTSLELAGERARPLTISECGLDAMETLRRRHARARTMTSFFDRMMRRLARGHSLHLMY